ncbi:hypothetical protein [Frigidibacter mobilis]|uniref:hypothetical protein n=1 Tax=Frigidibacter mobilis TaxID=1335048 RepID=UPI000A6062C4|nr:hypothetical protein [Frigidibacter mobilis]
MKRVLNDFRPFLGLFCAGTGRKLLGGAALAALTGLMGMALLGLSGWFITATALAGLVPATAWAFDVFMPSAAIRLFALGRTAARYGERLVTHDATLGLLAALRGQLFRGWSAPGAARALAMRPARLLFRLTADVDALDTVYLRVLVPLGTALVATLAAGIALAFISPALGFAVFAVLMLTGTFVAAITARSATPQPCAGRPGSRPCGRASSTLPAARPTCLWRGGSLRKGPRWQRWTQGLPPTTTGSAGSRLGQVWPMACLRRCCLRWCWWRRQQSPPGGISAHRVSRLPSSSPWPQPSLLPPCGAARWILRAPVLPQDAPDLRYSAPPFLSAPNPPPISQRNCITSCCATMRPLRRSCGICRFRSGRASISR